MRSISENSRQNEEKIAAVSPRERILLLSHCLRPGKKCMAKITREGLLCDDECQVNCILGKLKKLAERMEYKGVCIAPGGSMALKFVKKIKPQGIIAVACRKELEEGMCEVKKLIEKGFNFKGKNHIPVMFAIPLIRDGCVNTKVDEEEALRIIGLNNSMD